VTGRRLLERGKLRRVFAIEEGFAKVAGEIPAVRGGREIDRTGAGNVVNPLIGCGVQQTREPPKGSFFGRSLCGGNR